MQVFLPQGKMDLLPDMAVVGEDEIPYPVETSLIAESWNQKTKIWSGIFNMDLSIAFPGENMLILEYPDAQEDSPLRRELRVDIIQE
jgi:hypothetical protein